MSTTLSSLLTIALPDGVHGIPQLEILLALLLAIIKMIVVCIGLFFCWLALIVIMIVAFAAITRNLRATPRGAHER